MRGWKQPGLCWGPEARISPFSASGRETEVLAGGSGGGGLTEQGGFWSLFQEMATNSSVLAWRIPGMEEPGGLPSMGSHRVGHDEGT